MADGSSDRPMAGAPPAPGSRPSDLRTLARGGTLNLVGNVIAAVLGFALTVIVTRGLGAAGAGVFFAAVALFMIASNATELGADTGLVRFVARYRALGRIEDVRPTIRAAMWPVLAAGAVAAVVVFAFAPSFARLIHATGATGALFVRMFAPFLSVGAASTVALSGARGFGTMRPFVYVENIGKPAARALLAFALVLGGLGATAIALSWALPVVAGFAVGIAWLWRLTAELETRTQPLPPPTASPRALALEFWRFSAPRALAGLFQISITWLDVLLVSAMLPSERVGIYAATSRLIVVGTFVLQAVRLAIAPQISSLLAAGETRRAEHLYQVATWWTISVSWPLYLSLAVFAPFVLRAFGPAFVQGQHVLLILSLAMLVNLATGNVTTVLLMGGKSSWNLFNAFGALTLNVVLNLILIPRMGIEGAAIAWTASILFDNIAALVEVRWFLRIRPFGPGYVRAAAAALACFGLVGLLVRAISGEGWWSILAFGTIAPAAYVPVLLRSRDALHLDELVAAFRDRAARGASGASAARDD